MSWHYSLGLVEAYSEATCSDGAPSVPSNTNPTPQVYLSPDRMTAFSRLSRFGMTCEPLTESLGAELLTWYLEGFHVRTYPAQAEGLESQGPGLDCGQKCPASLVRYDRDTHSLRTAQCSLFEDSTACCVILPRSGMMRNGMLSERTTSAPRTSATEYGSSETYPTPNCYDAIPDYGNRKGSNTHMRKTGETAKSRIMNWPTPTAHNAKEGAYPAEHTRNTPTLGAVAGGQLNPTWVEWLMGWPLGWTDSKPLATDKFRQWQQQHSDCCTTDCVALTNAGR